MPDLSYSELDERLADLERDVGPQVRAMYRMPAMRPGFATEAWSRLISAEPTAPRPRARLRLVRRPAWAAVAAVLVGALVVGGAVFINRPRPVNAEVLDQLQAEAAVAMGGSPSSCLPHDPAHTTGAVALGAGPGVGTGGSPGSGPVTVSSTSAADLSERLAKALGVSGDRVRDALVATMRPHVDPLPQEPLTSVAQQLGLSRQQVCEAFLEPPGTTKEQGTVTHVTPDDGRPHITASLVVNGKAMDLSTVKADDVKVPAERLGVSADRLASALRAGAPSTPPPAPPAEHEIVGGLARNLGISEDKVRAALKEVEGNGPFVFVVPLPGLGR
jgi:hypothetical protein